MQSFTFGSDEGMQALIDAHNKADHTDDGWSFVPNSSDFKTLIRVLRHCSEEHDDEAAGDLLGSIAESLGIEFI